MSRIKVCPKCKHKNKPSDTICTVCGASLFNVQGIAEDFYDKQQQDLENTNSVAHDNAKIVDSDDTLNELPKADIQAEKNSSNQSSADNNEKVKLIKICPECNAENLGVAKICTKCRTNIKTVKPIIKNISANESNNNQSFTHNCNPEIKKYVGKLIAPDNSYKFTIDVHHPITIIGREHAMSDYLANKSYTSREHVQIQIIGEKLAIKDLGKQNGTYVNNVRLEPESIKILADGDKISLGGAWTENWQNSLIGCFIVQYN